MSHIAPVSFKVAATLAAYRIVCALTGTANTVQYPADKTVCPLGVTVDTVLETNQAIPVCISGIAKVEFNQTVGSGGLVESDSSGKGVAYQGVSTASYVIGTYIGDVMSATGTIGEVLLNIQQLQVP